MASARRQDIVPLSLRSIAAFVFSRELYEVLQIPSYQH